MEELGFEQRLSSGIWKSRVEKNILQVKKTIQNTQNVRKGTLNSRSKKKNNNNNYKVVKKAE